MINKSNSIGRIKTSILHSFFHMSHALETWVDLLWFSLVDIFVYGFMAIFFSGFGESATTLLIGIIMWEIVRISQYSITVGMMWEVWSRSFTTLFITPLTIWEFITGHAISGILKTIGVFILVSVIAKLAFGFNILIIGIPILIWNLGILFIFGTATGIFVIGLILKYGTTIQSFAWGLIFLFQPFSAIFYPLNVLPPAFRAIALISPITYVMENARWQLTNNTTNVSMLITGTILSFCYMFLGILYLKLTLKAAKKSGAFARMAM